MTSPHLHAGEVARWWSPDPLVIASVLIAAVLYAAGFRRARRAMRWWEVASFSAGLLVIAASLLSPLDRLSDILFSAHMTQHELLMLVAAPLLVIGRPLVPFLWGLPARWRAGIAEWSQRRPVRKSWRFITGALFALLAHAVAVWVWHIPSLFQAALRNDWIHAFQHFWFFATAALFWWAMVHGRFGSVGYGVAVLFVFTTALHTSILGALLTFARSAWYPLYEGTARQWNIDALKDQQLAGLIMWIPSGLVFIVAGLALFAAWLGQAERRISYSRTEQLHLLIVGLATLLAAACWRESPRERIRMANQMTGGDAPRGKALIRKYGCDSCHTIPGVATAVGNIGPPLDKIANRMYLAGRLENNPKNLITWIQYPTRIDEKTAMPEIGVSDSDARDIAAYLYTLR